MERVDRAFREFATIGRRRDSTGGDPVSFPCLLTDAMTHAGPGTVRDGPPTLVLLGGAATAGIAVDRWLDLPLVAWLAGLAGGVVYWWYCWRRDSRSTAGWMPLLIAWCSTGAIWHHVWWNVFPASEIALLANDGPQPVALRLMLTGEARQMALPPVTPLVNQGDEPRFRFPARVLEVRDGDIWRRASGQIEVFVRGHWDEGRAGDRVELFGEIALTTRARNPGQYDLREHQRGERRLAWVRVLEPQALTILERTGGWLGRFRTATRVRLDQLVHRHVSASQAPLASAILLGNRVQISQEEQQRYLLTGTVHILAISGLHMGIMAGGLFLLLRLGWIERRVSLALVMFTVLFYGWLVEYSAPVGRSAAMIAVFCLARIIGRPVRPSVLLACCGLVVLGLCPSSLLNAGAQLSFLAVAVLAWEVKRPAGRRHTDPLQLLIEQSRPKPARLLYWAGHWFMRTARVGGLIWLTATPLVAWRFHLFTPAGLVINPLVMVPMSLALYGGMLVMLFGGWMMPLAWLGGQLCSVSLAAIDWLVATGSRTAGGSLWVIGPVAFAVAAYYLWLGWLAWRDRRDFRVLPVIKLTAVWIVAGWCVPEMVSRALNRPGAGTMEAVFIDVGHGSATLVRFPDGRNLLFDAGSFGAPETGVRSVSAVLWSLGIDHLDALIVSHADTDHFNAVPGLCQRFSVGRVWMTPQTRFDDAPSVVYMHEELRRLRVSTGQLVAEDRLDCGDGVEATVLGPAEGFYGGNDNARSIVLLIEQGGRSLLLTGDIEPPGLERLNGFDTQRRTTIAAAPHHGSLNSSPEVFSEWCAPQLVVISADPDRIAGDCLSRWRELAPQVASTSEFGAIAVRWTEAGVESRHWLDGEWSWRWRAVPLPRWTN